MPASVRTPSTSVANRRIPFRIVKDSLLLAELRVARLPADTKGVIPRLTPAKPMIPDEYDFAKQKHASPITSCISVVRRLWAQTLKPLPSQPQSDYSFRQVL